MKINIGEIEINYELTNEEKNILSNEEQEYYKFIKDRNVFYHKFKKDRNVQQ